MVEQYVLTFWFGLVGKTGFLLISMFTLPISGLYQLYKLTEED